MANHNLTVGSIVTNFSQMAKVVEVRSFPFNDVILKPHGIDAFGGLWVADPAKCKLVEAEPTYRHRDGLVVF